MKKHIGKVIDKKGKYRIIDCKTCGFIHILPYPSNEKLKKYYQNEFIEERPLYTDRFSEDLEWWNLIYSDRYENFRKFFPKKKKPNILDIGSGLGHFLNYGKKKGWDVLGVEPGKKACSYSKKMGIKVINGLFGEVDLCRYAPFDVVHLSEVMEHVPCPDAILQESWKLLKPNGILCICVPNDYNPFQKLLLKEGFSPYWLSPKVHINYFNQQMISCLVERNGFDIVKKDVMFPMELFLIMGENYVGNDDVGRECHKKRKNWDIILSKRGMSKFRQKFYSFLADEGLGRESIIYAKRRIKI
ncbi:MAG: class I SAM-dependent methyltransferase [bacterium]